MSTENNPQDLTTSNGIQTYLRDCADGLFVATSVERISGGSANYTFRALLEHPYDHTSSLSKRLAPAEGTSVIVKHATGFAAAFETSVPLSVDRTDVETEALRLMSQALFGNSTEMSLEKIYIPDLLHYDAKNRIQILTDFGPLPTLKEFIIAHPSGASIAREMGVHLSKFLVTLHTWGYQMLRQPLMDRFKNNSTSRQICAWRTGGQLARVAKMYSVGKPEEWDAIVETLNKEVMEGNDTFNMGDFWTGNVLVKTVGEEDTLSLDALVVLDWELAKTGPASTDIAQFAAESFMLHHLASPHNIAGGALVSSFLSGYADAISRDSQVTEDIENPGLAREFFNPTSIMAHLSAHAAVWVDLVSWAKDDEVSGVSGKDITKKAVERALELCLRSSKGEYEIGEADVQQCAKRLVDILTEI